MLNSARIADQDRADQDREDAAPGAGYDRIDLKRAGGALVQLEAWCRQNRLDELAALIEPAADWADRQLGRNGS